MTIMFLSPWYAFLGFTALLPAVMVFVRFRKSLRFASVFMAQKPRFRKQMFCSALTILALLVLAVAAARPTAVTRKSHYVRKDAQVLVVFDTSRSMAASKTVNSRTRLDRGKDIAIDLRESLPGVSMGTVSLTDRLASHLLPTGDVSAFISNVLNVIDIENPPPAEGSSSNYAPYNSNNQSGAIVPVSITTFSPLTNLVPENFFSPAIKHRVVVLMTDGENTDTFGLAEIGKMLKSQHISLIIVQIWGGVKERVFLSDGSVEPYRPKRNAPSSMVRSADLLNAQLFTGDNYKGLSKSVARDLGNGPSKVDGYIFERLPLMPYLVLFAFILVCARLVENFVRFFSSFSFSSARFQLFQRKFFKS